MWTNSKYYMSQLSTSIPYLFFLNTNSHNPLESSIALNIISPKIYNLKYQINYR